MQELVGSRRRQPAEEAQRSVRWSDTAFAALAGTCDSIPAMARGKCVVTRTDSPRNSADVIAASVTGPRGQRGRRSSLSKAARSNP